MTEKQWKRNKLAAIMQLETYQILEAWNKNNYPNVPKYAVPSLKSTIYKKTNDWFYLSKWLEKFVVYYMKFERPDYKVHKVDNRGIAIPNRIVAPGSSQHGKICGVQGYRKNLNMIEGEPDIRIIRPNMQLACWMEVKIGNDTLKIAQRNFFEGNYGPCFLIKNVEDFLRAVEKI